MEGRHQIFRSFRQRARRAIGDVNLGAVAKTRGFVLGDGDDALLTLRFALQRAVALKKKTHASVFVLVLVQVLLRLQALLGVFAKRLEKTLQRRASLKRRTSTFSVHVRRENTSKIR